MFDPLLVPGTPVEDLSTGGLLERARSARRTAQAAEAEILAVAYAWAIAHPALPGEGAVFVATSGMVEDEPIAGQGCPEVAEWCLPELGAVLGISTTAATRLVGHALELRHRLPRLWAGVQSGDVESWRARKVAEATIHSTPTLTVEAARWIDAQVAAVAGKVGPTQLERTLAEAIERHHLTPPPRPEDDPEDGHLHIDPREVRVEDDQVGFGGTMRVEAHLSIADALDLDHALKLGAAHLKTLGVQAPLDVRRSMALGDLARRQLALNLADGSPAPSEPFTAKARRLDLHLHLTAESVRGLPDTGAHTSRIAIPAQTGAESGLVLRPTVSLDEGQRLVLLDHVKAWARDTFTEVRVLPILDLAAPIGTDAYAPTARLARQVRLRDRTCVFPWCTRPAAGCDLDHVVAYDHDAAATGMPQPGPTTSDNLAVLCRRHHRLKTHTAWTYRPDPDHPPGSGTWLWTSPHGHHYRRDRHGTTHRESAAPV